MCLGAHWVQRLLPHYRQHPASNIALDLPEVVRYSHDQHSHPPNTLSRQYHLMVLSCGPAYDRSDLIMGPEYTDQSQCSHTPHPS